MDRCIRMNIMRNKGLASIPLIISLVIMAIALPAMSYLVQKNQDVRNRAAGSYCCSNNLPNNPGQVRICEHVNSDGECIQNNNSGNCWSGYCGELVSYEGYDVCVVNGYCSAINPPTAVPPTATRAPTNTPTPTSIPCGALNEVCCAGNSCDTANLACIGGYCSCGAEGQVCCNGNVCSSNLGCVNNSCVAPTNTPTPSPTVVARAGVLNFKVSFLGKPKSGLCANWPVDVKVVDKNGVEKIYEEVATNDDGKGTVGLSGFSEKTDLLIYFAGPKQAWTKFGKNNQDGEYGSNIGKIVVTDDRTTSIKYDFSKYPILSGDVIGNYSSTNDKIISGRDFSKTKTAALERDRVEEGEDLYGDVDGNCVTNSLDITTVMLSLKRVRYEE